MSLGCVFEYLIRIAQFPAKSQWIQHPAVNDQAVGLVISWSRVHVLAGRGYRFHDYLSSSGSLNLRFAVPRTTINRQVGGLEVARCPWPAARRAGPDRQPAIGLRPEAIVKSRPDTTSNGRNCLGRVRGGVQPIGVQCPTLARWTQCVKFPIALQDA